MGVGTCGPPVTVVAARSRALVRVWKSKNILKLYFFYLLRLHSIQDVFVYYEIMIVETDRLKTTKFIIIITILEKSRQMPDNDYQGLRKDLASDSENLQLHLSFSSIEDRSE